MSKYSRRGFEETLFWLVCIWAFFLSALPMHPQLPVVNHNGTPMYAPDKPFESINIQSCTGPGCGGGVGAVSSVNGQTGDTVVGTVRSVNGQTGPVTTVTAASIGASPLPTDIPATIADYVFSSEHISGSTVADQSGHNNDATLGAGGEAPGVGDNGIFFDGAQNVVLPAAVNAERTWIYAIYINPLPHPFVPGYIDQSSIIQSSSMASQAGYNILLFGGNAGVSFDSFAPSYYNSGSRTYCPVLLSGFHVIAGTFAAGAPGDKLYVDGVECAEQNVVYSYGAQSSGHLYIGASTTSWTGKGLGATVYRYRAYAEQLTSSQIGLISGVIRAQLQERGVPIDPVPALLFTPQLHCIGDSLTQGYSATFSWCSALTLTNQPAYSITNWATFNQRLQGMAGSEPNRVGPNCITSTGPAVALLFAGSNDFQDGRAPSLVRGYLATEIAALKRGGCSVYVGTMIDRTDSAGTYKNPWDVLLLSQAKALGAAGIIDFAANPLVGADGASSNATYYTDGVHLTDAGQTLLATAASNSLNYYFGSNLANPTVVTATTYTLASGDGAVTAAPTGNAAYTMPDCTGPSGEAYVISNPQSAHTLTIQGGTSQPINGLTSAITIPSNSTVTIRDVPNPKSVSGCHWVM